MVTLVEKLGKSLKFGHRMENHHESHEVLIRASFQAFRSDISQTLVQILGDGKLGSLSWIQRCLEKFPMIETAFAKLAVSINFPMTKWGASVSEAYLSYTLNVLELLNKASSSISHLAQARLSLSHQLSTASTSIQLLNRIKPTDNIGNSFDTVKTGETRFSCSEELIVHEALQIMKSTGLQLFGVILSGLCGDPRPYFEVRKLSASGHFLQGLGLWRPSDLEEVDEVNDAAAKLSDPGNGDATEILARKLGVLEQALEATGKQADAVFSQVLSARTKYLDTIRLK